MESKRTSAPDRDAATAEDVNGRPEGDTNGSAADDREAALRRAEEMVDRWGEQIGRTASSIGRTFLRWAARAREEAEDIWADAQALRARQQAADEPPQERPADGK